MEDKIHFEVVSADGIVFECMANYVSAPLADGTAGFLAGHAPVLAALTEGVIKCCMGENDCEYIAVSGGVLSIANNELSILARTAEKAETIDIARAQSSERRAQQRLHDSAHNVDLKRAELSLHRALAREKAYYMIHK